MGQLRREIDTPIWVRRKVLDSVAEDFSVADDSLDVVWGADGRSEQANLLDRPRRGHHEAPHLEGLQDHQEYAPGKVCKKAGPSHANGNSGGRQQCGEAGSLDAKKAKDGDNKHNV